MGRFRVTVTKRSDEWAESNPPLEPSAPATGRGEDPALAADGPHALGCAGNLDTPGYAGENENALGCTGIDTPGYASGSLGCVGADTPGYASGALGCTTDTPGYGDEGPKALGCTPLTGDPAGYGDGPISPLGD